MGRKISSYFSSRRNTVEPSLTYTNHYISEQQFQRYNLARFPCSLKRLETSFDKLIELCVTTRGKN